MFARVQTSVGRVLCGLLLIGTAARAEIEFVGVLAMSQLTRFALSDSTKGTTEWVAQGGSFADYVVRSYDSKQDILTLVRGETVLRLKLKDDAKVKDSRLELTGSITFGADQKVEIERATLVFGQENVFPLKDGITYRITPTRFDDGTIRYHLEIERSTDGNTRERVSAPTITALQGQSFKVQIGDFGFAFSPR